MVSIIDKGLPYFKKCSQKKINQTLTYQLKSNLSVPVLEAFMIAKTVPLTLLSSQINLNKWKESINSRWLSHLLGTCYILFTNSHYVQMRI